MGLRCTDCGRIVQPVVACDIDGTLGDFHGHFISFIQTYLQREPRLRVAYGGGDPGTFRQWVMASWKITDDDWHDIKLAYRQGGMKRSMPLFTDARGFTDRLRLAGIEVWLTTTRPYLRLDNIDPDTRFWLDLHGVKYDHLIYNEDKYRVLREQVQTERVIAVVDDLPEQYDSVVEVYGPEVALLRKHQYNRRVERPDAVLSLRAAETIIFDRLERWRESHAAG